MKKALFIPGGCSNVKGNEFESCRGEGRVIINNAFGFSLLGYECHIALNGHDKSPIKKVFDNVYFNREVDYNEDYDILMSFCGSEISSNPLYRNDNFKHKIVVNHYHTDKLLEDIQKNNLDITVSTGIPITNNELTLYYKNKDIYYLPTLSPIPSVNIGFLPYKYEPKLPELKVYVSHGSWSGYDNSNDIYIHKQLLILEFLKLKGYKLNLYVGIVDEKTLENSPFIKNYYNQIHYINHKETFYDDIIKIIRDVDLCIPNRGGYDAYGSSAIDMISLGTPIISIVDGILREESNFNRFYNCPYDIIIIQESDKISLKKLERMFSNMERTYNCFKKQIIDYSFDNWKIFAEDIIKSKEYNINTMI